MNLPTDEFGGGKTASVLVGAAGWVSCQGVALYDGVNYTGEIGFAAWGAPVPDALQKRASSARVVGALPNAPYGLYSEPDATGRCSTLPVDMPNLGTLGVGDNQVASIKVGFCPNTAPGNGVSLFAGASYAGERLYVESDIPDLASVPFDNRVVSLMTAGTQKVALFAEPNYKGACSVVPPGRLAQLADRAIGNGTVSSLKIGGTCYAPEALTADPASYSRPGSNVIDLFGRATDNTLYHRRYDGTQWLDAESFGSVGGGVFSTPAVASWGGDRLDVFVRGVDGMLYQRYYESGVWHEWLRLTPTNVHLTSAPAAVSWGHGRYDVFAKGAPDGLLHVWWDGSSWHHENFGGHLLGAPTVTSQGAWKLDVFFRSPANANGTVAQLQTKVYDGQWRAPVPVAAAGVVSADPTSGIAAASWAAGRVDLFARGADNKLWHTVYANGVWTEDPAGYPGGSLVSGPSVSTRGAGKLDVFARTSDVGGVVSQRSYDSQWLGWARVS